MAGRDRVIFDKSMGTHTKTETKELQVVFQNAPDGNWPIAGASNLADAQPRHYIDEIPWLSFPYKPEASFTIAHTGSLLLLKYFIKERFVRAVHREINSPVHKDSCVEIFIGLEGEEEYYNYEFNCLGICSAGFGSGRHGRKKVPENIIRKIKADSLLSSVSDGGIPLICWELTLILPIEIFCFHRITSWQGQVCRGNFYKCGDDLPEPHFITWNHVAAEKPDFHRPESFGRIVFE